MKRAGHDDGAWAGGDSLRKRAIDDAGGFWGVSALRVADTSDDTTTGGTREGVGGLVGMLEGRVIRLNDHRVS